MFIIDSSCLSLTDYMFSIISFLVSVCVSLVSLSVLLLIPLHHFHHVELTHVSVFSQLVMVFTSCFILIVLCLLHDVFSLSLERNDIFSCTCPLTRFCWPVPYFPRLCSLPLVRPAASIWLCHLLHRPVSQPVSLCFLDFMPLLLRTLFIYPFVF